MKLRDVVKRQDALVLRLIVGELLSRRGEGPLARRRRTPPRRCLSTATDAGNKEPR